MKESESGYVKANVGKQTIKGLHAFLRFELLCSIYKNMTLRTKIIIQIKQIAGGDFRSIYEYSENVPSFGPFH